MYNLDGFFYGLCGLRYRNCSIFTVKMREKKRLLTQRFHYKAIVTIVQLKQCTMTHT